MACNPSHFRNVLSSITIEPVFLLLAMCYGSYILSAKELYIVKVCNVNLYYSREICDNFHEHKEVEVEVQEYVATLQAYNSIIQAIPGCIYVLFAGPWSDRNGRKLLLIFPVCGYILNNGIFLINSYFFYELKAEYLLLECIQGMDVLCSSHIMYYKNIVISQMIFYQQ